MRSTQLPLVAPVPVFASFQEMVRSCPDVGAGGSTARLVTCKSGYGAAITETVVEALLLLSAVLSAFCSAMAEPKSVVTVTFRSPIPAAPSGRVKSFDWPNDAPAARFPWPAGDAS